MTALAPSINLIDIGAVGGLDKPWARHSGKVANLLCFEPNEEPVFSENMIKLDTAVWDRNGEMTFRVYGEDGTGSSLLEQNYDWVRENWDDISDQGDSYLNETWFERSQEKARFSCKVGRLDEVLRSLRKAQSNIPERYQFLKSDTQSGEWYVLQGAQNYLQDECLGLELEVFNKPLYKEVVCEDEVIAFLTGYGFEVAGYTPYEKSFLSQRDLLFLKKDTGSDEMPAIELIKDVYGVTGKDKLIKKPSLTARARKIVRDFLK